MSISRNTQKEQSKNPLILEIKDMIEKVGSHKEFAKLHSDVLAEGDDIKAFNILTNLKRGRVHEDRAMKIINQIKLKSA